MPTKTARFPRTAASLVFVTVQRISTYCFSVPETTSSSSGSIAKAVWRSASGPSRHTLSTIG